MNYPKQIIRESLELAANDCVGDRSTEHTLCLLDLKEQGYVAAASVSTPTSAGTVLRLTPKGKSYLETLKAEAE